MATATSTGNGPTIDQLRDRLQGAAPPEKKARPSVASDIRALLPEVRMKRAAGWTWEQIAAALYDDEAKASAIRTAYNRLLRRKGKGKSKGRASIKSSDSNGGSDTPPTMPCPAPPSPIEKPPSSGPSSPLVAGRAAAARPPLPNLFGQLNDRAFG